MDPLFLLRSSALDDFGGKDAVVRGGVRMIRVPHERWQFGGDTRKGGRSMYAWICSRKSRILWTRLLLKMVSVLLGDVACGGRWCVGWCAKEKYREDGGSDVKGRRDTHGGALHVPHL